MKKTVDELSKEEVLKIFEKTFQIVCSVNCILIFGDILALRQKRSASHTTQ